MAAIQYVATLARELAKLPEDSQMVPRSSFGQTALYEHLLDNLAVFYFCICPISHDERSREKLKAPAQPTLV
jgi:hypothetical protein